MVMRAAVLPRPAPPDGIPHGAMGEMPRRIDEHMVAATRRSKQ
jgi:hypothetical protein